MNPALLVEKSEVGLRWFSVLKGLQVFFFTQLPISHLFLIPELVFQKVKWVVLDSCHKPQKAPDLQYYDGLSDEEFFMLWWVECE